MIFEVIHKKLKKISILTCINEIFKYRVILINFMTYLAKNYNRKKISFKYGKGSYLYSKDNKRYLDFVQGIAVNSLGHSNPYLIKEMYKQAKKIWHVSNAFIIPEGEMLAKRLTKKTFADSVIFQNSGAEAIEASIKVARRYFY